MAAWTLCAGKSDVGEAAWWLVYRMCWAPASRAASMAAALAVSAPRASDRRGDDQDALGAFEGVFQAARFGEVAGPDPDAAFGEAGGLAHVAHADADPLCRHRLEQAVDDQRPEAAGGSRDDQHRWLLSDKFPTERKLQ